ncbi:MAG: phosphatase PAP2 family protein [Nitrospirales bacterium]|nr:phosphatase PAP2 family protein [Nitrospira sp.]MDR4499905.1 phosphatase PAP2 family protein [Nitrospirales bacterium]
MSWDEWLFRTVNGWAGRFEFLDWSMYEFSQEGNLLLPGILLVIYWSWTNWREARIAGPSLALLIGLSDIVGGQLKLLIGRPRPCHVFAHIHELVGCGGTMSLPSNHAFNSATAAAFLHLLYPSTGWIAWPLVGFIGLSRVYLGAHYVTDVFAGWILGIILGGSAGFLLARSSWIGRGGTSSTHHPT